MLSMAFLGEILSSSCEELRDVLLHLHRGIAPLETPTILNRHYIAYLRQCHPPLASLSGRGEGEGGGGGDGTGEGGEGGGGKGGRGEGGKGERHAQETEIWVWPSSY